jgi:hypothetical protein
MIVQPTHDFECPQIHVLNRRFKFFAIRLFQTLGHLPRDKSTQANIGDALGLREQILGGLHLAERGHGLVLVKQVLGAQVDLVRLVLLVPAQSGVLAFVLVEFRAPFSTVLVEIDEISRCIYSGGALCRGNIVVLLLVLLVQSAGISILSDHGHILPPLVIVVHVEGINWCYSSYSHRTRTAERKRIKQAQTVAPFRPSPFYFIVHRCGGATK